MAHYLAWDQVAIKSICLHSAWVHVFFTCLISMTMFGGESSWEIMIVFEPKQLISRPIVFFFRGYGFVHGFGWAKLARMHLKRWTLMFRYDITLFRRATKSHDMMSLNNKKSMKPLFQFAWLSVSISARIVLLTLASAIYLLFFFSIKTSTFHSSIRQYQHFHWKRVDPACQCMLCCRHTELMVFPLPSLTITHFAEYSHLPKNDKSFSEEKRKLSILIMKDNEYCSTNQSEGFFRAFVWLQFHGLSP